MTEGTEMHVCQLMSSRTTPTSIPDVEVDENCAQMVKADKYPSDTPTQLPGILKTRHITQLNWSSSNCPERQGPD